jgi:hypothetical protein
MLLYLLRIFKIMIIMIQAEKVTESNAWAEEGWRKVILKLFHSSPH